MPYVDGFIVAKEKTRGLCRHVEEGRQGLA